MGISLRIRPGAGSKHDLAQNPLCHGLGHVAVGGGDQPDIQWYERAPLTRSTSRSCNTRSNLTCSASDLFQSLRRAGRAVLRLLELADLRLLRR